MSAEYFLDTNVIVYLFDETDTDKRRQAGTLVKESLERGTGCISYQVVQETLNVVIRKIGVPPEAVRRLLDEVLTPLWQVNPTVALYHSATYLQTRYGFSFYDSLIVSAAIEAGCSQLYSEDLQHGQQIQRLTILNPFMSQ